jgi:hypothetical protein
MRMPHPPVHLSCRLICLGLSLHIYHLYQYFCIKVGPSISRLRYTEGYLPGCLRIIRLRKNQHASQCWLSLILKKFLGRSFLILDKCQLAGNLGHRHPWNAPLVGRERLTAVAQVPQLDYLSHRFDRVHLSGVVFVLSFILGMVHENAEPNQRFAVRKGGSRAAPQATDGV